MKRYYKILALQKALLMLINKHYEKKHVDV